jgi:hypothetical protein
VLGQGVQVHCFSSAIDRLLLGFCEPQIFANGPKFGLLLAAAAGETPTKPYHMSNFIPCVREVQLYPYFLPTLRKLTPTLSWAVFGVLLVIPFTSESQVCPP